jgi:hypothetical protein
MVQLRLNLRLYQRPDLFVRCRAALGEFGQVLAQRQHDPFLTVLAY